MNERSNSRSYSISSAQINNISTDDSLPVIRSESTSSLVKHHGNLTVLTGTVFIIGEVAGGGILSLPHAVSGAGWFGVPLIALCCANAGFAGICLAKAWLILEERYPEYRSGLTRKPFSTIGYRAFGNWGSAIVSISMNFTRFGTGVVFLILTSQLLQQVMSHVNKVQELGICSWVPIVGVSLTPFMWLGSPADFWPAAYTAMLSTILGSILLLADIGLQAKDRVSSANYPMPTFVSFFKAFGNILFAFGGASAFPNFQNDMKEKDKFPKAVIYGFIGLLLLYIPVSGGGYGVFGDQTAENIVQNLPQSALTTVIDCFFLVHCYTAFLIIVNPVLLELEDMLKIPKIFNWKRCVFRTALMAAMIFTGLSVPSFGPILDLLGGTTITLMAFVLPPAFYLKLCRADPNGEFKARHVPLYTKIILAEIAIVGIFGGAASTYSSITWFADPESHMEPACYAGRSAKTYFINN
ncbi:uncharacterized protein LOC128954069 [Oppia nitens]|uniref:uncharacterized protein LOC128954069 n=1 Tax=Oppia nitens TaxID=1686743 RepID=UPI0023DC6936|nr:uncharacterized protein LOC128954069 [Oppia nitens]